MTEFNIVLLPDTQNMVASYPAIWETMPQWCSNNKTTQNIQAVIGLGDVTNNASDVEFTEAMIGWDILKASGIPFFPLIGNHDYDNGYDVDRNATKWKTYFPLSYVSSQSCYGGSYEGDTINYWGQISYGGTDYLILCLELFPRTVVITWAESVMSAHPNSKVILATHAWLRTNGNRFLSTDPYGSYFNSQNDAETMWQTFISHPNIILIVGGHDINGATSSYTKDQNNSAKYVAQLFIDHQNESNGGNGYMGLLHFLPDTREIHVTTYSSYLDSLDTTGEYLMDYDSRMKFLNRSRFSTAETRFGKRQIWKT